MDLQKPNQNLKLKKIHFIGIGGIGMSAIARYFHSKDSIISGSDKEHSALISTMEKEGINNIWTGHNKNNIEKVNPDYVIYSTAVTKDNEELIWAKENKKEILHRSDLLQYATASKKVIAISGTHGKTTTTAMITEMLLYNGLEPSAILGGILTSRNTNVILGNGDYFIIEADESDKSFLKGNPEIAVITNIEADHLENFPFGLEEIKNSFKEFANKSISKKGLVACCQDKNTKELISENFNLNEPKLITYSINENNKSATLNASFNNNSKSWDIFLRGKFKVSIKLKNPGKHNVLNALSAFGVGYLLGLNPEKIKEALENYKGVKRRFEILTKSNEITIIDDYAHHPTEIAVTIEAAKELPRKRMIVVLQPHQPIRLKDLWKEFIDVLKNQNDLVFITDTYLARGTIIEGISSQKLVQEINKPNVNYLPGNIDQIAKYLEKIITDGDLVLIMGAGDITNLGPKLINSHKVLASKFGNN